MINDGIRFAARAAMLPAFVFALSACGGSDAAADSAAGATSSATQPAAAADSTPAPGGSMAADSGTLASGALLDPNNATREQLVAVPGMTPAAADALIAGRPYADMVAVNRVLAAQVADSTARVGIYGRIFRPIDLNSAKGEEILLIPGVGKRMRHEFEEYRPYRNIEQFRREIGKYVDKDEVARLERYVTIR